MQNFEYFFINVNYCIQWCFIAFCFLENDDWKFIIENKRANFIIIHNMNLPPLPNNRLILNGHKLHTQQDMLAYVSKRLKQKNPIVSLDMLVKILSAYDQLQIAIWHSDTFLWSEKEGRRGAVVQTLQKHRLVKMS